MNAREDDATGVVVGGAKATFALNDFALGRSFVRLYGCWEFSDVVNVSLLLGEGEDIRGGRTTKDQASRGLI